MLGIDIIVDIETGDCDMVPKGIVDVVASFDNIVTICEVIIIDEIGLLEWPYALAEDARSIPSPVPA